METIKKVKETDKELSYGYQEILLETNMLEKSKMTFYTDMELTHGKMETNTLVYGKMVINTDKELTRMQMEQLEMVSGIKVN